MFPNKTTMQYVLTNTLNIVHSTRVNNTVHTYTDNRAYVCTQNTPTYIDISGRISFTVYDFRNL